MLKLIPFLTIMLGIFLHVSELSGQTLVSGTSFDPQEITNEAYFDINKIKFYGVQNGTIRVTPPLTSSVLPDHFSGSFNYAITNNPANLDAARYQNITASADYMFISSAKPSGADENILEYEVTDMKPGSAVLVTITYAGIIDPAYANCASAQSVFEIEVNSTQSNDTGVDSEPVSPGQIVTQNFTGTVNEAGTVLVKINALKETECFPVAIKSIEVNGFINPTVRAKNGNEFCVGEWITLEVNQKYDLNHQWQVKNGADWIDLGTNERQGYELLEIKDYSFRLLLSSNGNFSEISNELIVSSRTCCTSDEAPASKHLVYYDNFGRVDLTDKTGNIFYVWDYSNILNPVEVQVAADAPFRKSLQPHPLNATWKAAGVVEDGEYTVAAYLTAFQPYNNISGAMLGWANRVTGPVFVPDIAYDHSGKLDGAALFINCSPNSVGVPLYTRTIDNLCPGKELFFEVWIAVFTNEAFGPYQGVNVTVRLIDEANPINMIEETGEATRQADGGGVWVKVSSQILLSGTSMQIQIINNQNASMEGNDLVIDDIKVLACLPPSLDLYSDMELLSKTVEVCNDVLHLISEPTQMLKNYFSNNLGYLYQWSKTPSDLSSWKNIDLPQTAPDLTIEDPLSHISFAGSDAGDKIYFRMIAANQPDFALKNNFQGTGNEANLYDPCRSYSVSPVMEAVVSGNCLITGTTKPTLASHIVFPNPATDHITIKGNVSKSAIYNALGEMEFESNASSLNISSLAAGIYTVHIKFKNGTALIQKLSNIDFVKQ